MSKRVMAILLMSTLVLSLACGCKNNDTESTSSTASKTESSLSSNKESSKQNDSKTESSKQSESSTDKDYEEMMSRVNKLSSKLTYDQVYEIMGEPDGRTGSGVDYAYYKFGKYTVEIIDFNYSVIIHNNETGETTKIY